MSTMPKPTPGDTFVRTHVCAICGREYKHPARQSKYCPECRERPFRDKWRAAHDAIVDTHDDLDFIYHPRSRCCVECRKSFFPNSAGERVCPVCIEADKRRKREAMHDPWEPEFETYAEYQRRTNPASMYADGRHLDELVGARGKGGTHA